MRLTKVKTIASFEFRRAVTRPAFLFMTFGLPIFLGLLAGGPAYLQREALTRELDRTSLYAVVDYAGILPFDSWAVPFDSMLPSQRRDLPAWLTGSRVMLHETLALVPFTEEEARELLQQRRVDGIVIVPRSYIESGRLKMVVPAGPRPLDVSAAATRGHARTLLIDGLLRGEVDDSVAARVSDPVARLEHYELDQGGALRRIGDAGLSAVARMLVPVVLSMLLLMALMTTGGYLVQGIGVEKENRVIEVLLATVRPQEILAGKLIGLGGAGLFQFGVWATGFVLTLIALLGLLEELAVRVPWEAIALAPVLFIVGYLFYGSLMLATGSLGQTASESQKLTLMWGMLALLPMLFLPSFLDQPHGLTALLMHWIPFTAPLAIVLRLAQDPTGVGAWEIAGSVGVLITCTWLAVRVGARLFRVGVLLSGGWPGWRQVLRQAEIVG